MNVALLWRWVVRQLEGAARAAGRFLGPFPPAGPDAKFTPDFRVHASYGRFVFSMHALGPRQEPLFRAGVHTAINGSDSRQKARPPRHRAEMALIANAQRHGDLHRYESTRPWINRVHPSSITNSSSLKGSEIVVGEIIDMPSASNTVATIRSTTTKTM